jgi:hypothetical protein
MSKIQGAASFNGGRRNINSARYPQNPISSQVFLKNVVPPTLPAKKTRISSGYASSRLKGVNLHNILVHGCKPPHSLHKDPDYPLREELGLACKKILLTQT